MCISLLIYTVRPCLIHTFHAMPMPCSDLVVLLKATAQHGRLSTAMLCRGLEKNGMVWAWHGHGMESVNQTRPHCVNQKGKTHSKPLAARHGRGTAWARHVMCKSASSVYPHSRTSTWNPVNNMTHFIPNCTATKLCGHPGAVLEQRICLSWRLMSMIFYGIRDCH